MPSARAAPGRSASVGTNEAGTVWVLTIGPPPSRSGLVGRTTVSPTVEANRAVKLRSTVSENIRIPVTKATPSTIANVLSSRRTRRANRLLREARIIGSGRHPGHLVEHLLAAGVAQLVDHATVGEEQDPIGPGSGHRVVGHHHHGLAV